jgi:RNA polymerase subunit RPABC4/transcription elongation factor Spt4
MTDTLASLVDPSILTAVGSAIGAAGVGLWLAAAWWTYADMGRRTGSEIARFTAAGWVLLSTPLLLPLSLPVYLLARPQTTLGQRRSREMVEALGPSFLTPARCDTCGQVVDEAWQRCPTCATWLQVACADCGRWSPSELEICPWCATARGTLDEDAEMPAFEPAPRLVPSPVLGGPAPALEPVPLTTRRTPGPRELRRGAPGRGSEVAVGGAPAAFGR